MRVRLIRVPLAIVLFAAAMGQVPPAQAEEMTPQEVVFAGHGWGHGVGMSQYGARALAEEGRSAEEIVGHYFTGATVTQLSTATSGWLANDPAPLWVHLLTKSAPSSVTLAASGAGLELCQQEPSWVDLMREGKNDPEYVPYNLLLEQRLQTSGQNPGPIDGVFDSSTTQAVKSFQAARGLTVDGLVGENTKNALWPFDSSDRCVISTPLTTTARSLTPNSAGTQCVFTGASLAGDCRGSIRGLTTSKRVTLSQRKVHGTSMELARGTVRIRPDRSGGVGSFEGIHVVLEIDVDGYARGIDEMPFAWPDEALEAQAIASRSYGVGTAEGKGAEATFSGSIKDSCWCHLWSTTSSQVYAGYFAETYYYGEWAKAADATAGRVLTHPNDSLVTAFFSSSNGGASEANEDAWGSNPVPYLRSVDDPWSLDPANPFADWSYTYESLEVAAKVGMDELTGVDVVETNQSGSAKTVRFVGISNGVEVSIEKTGAWVRSVFGLRSNHYDVGWGDATAPPTASPPPAEPPTFSDIDGNTFEEDIEWAYETGVTKGCNPPDNTRFCPDDRVTRGQMAAFLTRFLDLPATSTDFFADDDGSTFENDINRLAAAGITKGCSTTRFCPSNSVTREQMAAFLARAFDLKESSHPGFVDVAASNTFVNDISRLATAGITKGCNPPANSMYCPKGAVTRAQMTAFLHRSSGH